MEWVLSPQTRHLDGRDQEGICGLSEAACALVRSSNLSSMLSTRSNVPVSVKAVCGGTVAISGFVLWVLGMHAAELTAALSTVEVSVWLTAAVAT